MEVILNELGIKLEDAYNVTLKSFFDDDGLNYGVRDEVIIKVKYKKEE